MINGKKLTELYVVLLSNYVIIAKPRDVHYQLLALKEVIPYDQLSLTDARQSSGKLIILIILVLILYNNSL